LGTWDATETLMHWVTEGPRMAMSSLLAAYLTCLRYSRYHSRRLSCSQLSSSSRHKVSLGEKKLVRGGSLRRLHATETLTRRQTSPRTANLRSAAGSSRNWLLLLPMATLLTTSVTYYVHTEFRERASSPTWQRR